MSAQLTIEFRNESYWSLDDLGSRQRQVYDCIRRHGRISNRGLSEALRLPINCVTGRVKELRDAGAVCVAGSVYDAVTNRNVTLFSISDGCKPENG